jgi:hypothetical protein
VTRLDRLKRGSGMKGRDDRSSGIEIRITDVLAKINPTDPLILAKQDARRNLNCSDSSASKQVYFQLNKKKAKAGCGTCHGITAKCLFIMNR